MRNISFDESSVLRELSRILGENEIVKTAAGPETLPGPTQNPMPSTKVSAFDEQILAFPMINMLNKGQRITDGSALLKELGSPEFKKFVDGWSASPDVDGKNKAMVLKSKVKPFVLKLQAQLKKMPANYQEAYSQSIANALALVSKASAESEINKQGADKLYDVSGETGEDLVDQAHKGGGTATELTHSKTKENLVETIVEQQERDVEVAKKAPKGTYATLVNLYNKLSKLGHADKLEGLKNAIQLIATEEDVVEHTLITLADELDTLGYAKQANAVDGILKKSVASPTAAVVDVKSVKQQISKRAEDFNVAQAKNQLISWINTLNPRPEEANVRTKATQMISRLPTDDLDRFMQSLLSIGQYVAGSNSDIGNIIGDQIAKIQKMYPEYKKQVEEKNSITIKPQNPMVMAFQQRFNKMFAGKYKKIKEDGIVGPETKNAIRIMREEKEGKAQQPQERGEKQKGIDKNIVLQELRSAFDRKFRNANYLNSPSISDYLSQEADKLVSQYNKTPNAHAGILGMWVNQVISGLTKEDVEKAI